MLSYPWRPKSFYSAERELKSVTVESLHPIRVVDVSVLRIRRSTDFIGWTKTFCCWFFSFITRWKFTDTISLYLHWRLETLKLKTRRKLTSSQKNNGTECRANKENPVPTTIDFSSVTIRNNSPNYSTFLFHCFEDFLSGNSSTMSSLMDTTEVKTTFGTSVLDKFCQKGFLADAESSQKR